VAETTSCVLRRIRASILDDNILEMRAKFPAACRTRLEREMTEAMKIFGEQFGLLPLYAVIIAYLGFSASNLRHLLMVMSILCGVYIAMFKAFNLKAKFGIIDVTQFLPVSQEIGNMVVAAVFVYLIGFAAYGLKRAFVTQDAA
jgi:hypothetical protein